jgi:hypothetical protein
MQFTYLQVMKGFINKKQEAITLMLVYIVNTFLRDHERSKEYRFAATTALMVFPAHYSKRIQGKKTIDEGRPNWK